MWTSEWICLLDGVWTSQCICLLDGVWTSQCICLLDSVWTSQWILSPVPAVQSLAINRRHLNGASLCEEETAVKTPPHSQELKNVDQFGHSYSLYMTKIDWNVFQCQYLWTSKIKPAAVPTYPSTKPWYNLTYDRVGFESPSARNRRPQWRGCSYHYGVLLTERERERERETESGVSAKGFELCGEKSRAIM